MFRFIWTLSVRTRDFLHRYMPSNRLLAAIRTRRGLKWGLPAMLVAALQLAGLLWAIVFYILLSVTERRDEQNRQ